jgi:signal transduction histidine kinase
MTFHIRHVRGLIEAIRSSDDVKTIKIMVGGYPFNIAPGLWREVGADGFSRDGSYRSRWKSYQWRKTVMSIKGESVGIAFLCDAEGNIQEIVSDSLGFKQTIENGQSFTSFVDKECIPKAESFLATLHEKKAAFNWELNVSDKNDSIISMHFAGGATDDGFIIVGAKSHSGVTKFYNELVKINNEQTNTLRSAHKDLSLQVRAQSERDSHLYDELSHLNNELATVQRELAKKNAELARLNEQKNQFLGIASHDLRNPLEVILTYSQFLREDAADKLSEEQIEFINIIRSSSEFMLNLVNDFLDFSKIEAGKLELDLTSADLVKLIGENVARNRALAEQEEIRINFNHNGELPKMRLDVFKIEQVLNNLIGNAIKFSPFGGEIDVLAKSE